MSDARLPGGMVDLLGEGALPCHHWPVTGSTLYRRLPNGSWAAQREDLPAGQMDAESHEAEMAHAGAVPVVAGAVVAGAPVVAAGSGGSDAGTADPVPASPQPTIARPTKRRRRWSIWRIIRWALAAYLIWLVVLVGYAAVSLDKIDALSPDPIADTDGTVWLLVGSDSRDGLTKKQQKKLKTGRCGGPADRHDHAGAPAAGPDAHPGLHPARLVGDHPRTHCHRMGPRWRRAAARSMPRSPTAGRPCSARRSSTTPACMSTTTWRSAWAGSST